jgi:cell wall-associated NlpC family hydrolase
MRNRKVRALIYLLAIFLTFTGTAVTGQSAALAKNAEIKPKATKSVKVAKKSKSSKIKFNPDAQALSAETINVAIAAALSKEDAAYRAGGSGPNSFDCSGLVKWAFAQAGVSLPHGSNNQIKVVKPISRDELQPGDLVFSGRSGGGIQHVALYIGDGKVIHATYPTASRANQVRIDDLDGSWVMVHKSYGRVLK